MREIEFRGKDRTGIMYNDWFYGSLDLTTNEEYPRIICKDKFNNVMFIDVNKDTVGQYIGKKDRNGIKIFDGDILEYEFEDIGKQKAYVKWNGKYSLFTLEVISEDFEYAPIELGVVIGNIYDNSELLKENKL